jgi:membrane protein
MGERTAKALEAMIKSADNRGAGIWAALVGLVVLIATASGVFGEVQSAMNAIWKAKPRSSTLSRLARARLNATVAMPEVTPRTKNARP